MTSIERERVMSLKRERALLQSRLSTAVDKQLLLLNQVIDLRAERDQLTNELAELSVAYQRCVAQREELHRKLSALADGELNRGAV